MIEEEYIRLIFGLKLKQLRNERELSLFGLAKKTGLSKSYLNEIEKGKKYPKRDKILLIADALEIDYDTLVSLKLDKNLAPVGELLQSRILKEIPLDLFGIRESDLIDIIAEAPVKVNTFISTLIEIAKNYSLTRESFYLAALRSYQEAHSNYFEELELCAEKFSKRYNLSTVYPLTSEELRNILEEEYGYKVQYGALDLYAESRLRSVFQPQTKSLLLASGMDDSQLAFIFAKELYYQYQAVQQRLYTFTWIKFESFDQVLNNFKASYFAGALVLPRKALTADLKQFFALPNWQPLQLQSIMAKYTQSPEMFYQRLTNLLPSQFNLRNLFFLRFSTVAHSQDYTMDKELHITRLSDPHANVTRTHYCRRWAGLRALKHVSELQTSKSFIAQISAYEQSENQYVVLASAMRDPFEPNKFRSITLGIHYTADLLRKIPFLQQREIPTIEVGVTCEACSLSNCEVRASPPTALWDYQRNEATAALADALISGQPNNLP